MIKNTRDGYVCTCDGCGEKLPATDTFEEAVELKTLAGWGSEKDETTGRWFNYCPDCQY